MNALTLLDLDGGFTYKRIHRKSVEKYLREGKDVLMQACKLNPLGPMGHVKLLASDYRINNNKWITDVIHFEALCCDYESGYYPSFYVEV